MRALVSIILLVGATAAATTAWADDVEMRNAQTRFDEGRALAAKGQYDEARVKFLQAYAVLKSPDSLYNLAYTETRSQHPVEAMRHFRVLLRDPNTPPDLVERSKKFVPDLEKVTAHVRVRAPDGADVSVDGTVFGRAPLADPVDVPPGSHTFGIALNGKTLAKDLSAKEGESPELALAFPDVEGPKDGIAPPKTTTEQRRPVAGWLVPIGLGVIAIGTGTAAIGFGAGSSSAKSDADRLVERLGPSACPPSVMNADCAQLRNLRGTQDSNFTLATVFGVVAGVTLVSAVGTFLFWPKTIVTVGVAQNGASIQGTF
jgi:hypothetical protein